MSEKVLYLEFLWFPKEEEFADIDDILKNKETGNNFKPTGPLLKLKKDISDFCGFPIFIKEFKRRVELQDTQRSEAKKIDKAEDSSTEGNEVEKISQAEDSVAKGNKAKKISKVKDVVTKGNKAKKVSNAENNVTKVNKANKSNKAEEALFYLEFLFNVSCVVNLEKGIEGDIRHFVNLFSSVKHGKLIPDLRLRCEPSLFNVEISILTENAPKDVERFSLGNFIGLKTFRERFQSQTALKDEGYKITQNRLAVLHDYKKLLLYFVVGKICNVKKRNATNHRLHKLEIPYSSLHSIVVSKNEGMTAFIQLTQSPLMYSVVQEEDEERDYISIHDVTPTTPWFRAIDLYKDCPSYFRKEFTMNTVLKLDFKYEDYDFVFEMMIHCKNIDVSFAPVGIIKAPVPPVDVVFKLDNYECYYALQCLLTHSYEINDQLLVRNEVEKVRNLLQAKSKANPVALCEAMYLVHDALVKGNTLIFVTCLNILYDRLQSQSITMAKEVFCTNSNETREQIFIKRCHLTPTRVVLLPPQLTMKNRALRDVDPNYSLRLAIKDDNMDTLNFTVRSKDGKKTEFFKEHFKKKLMKGIQIGNRCFKYVGASTSQMKGHGLWCYARDEQNRTADDVSKMFGDIEEIKDVPKYMARMGQTFSQSMGRIKVPQSWTNIDNPENDIEGGTKKYLELPEWDEEKRKFLKKTQDVSESDVEQNADPYIFSDGVGRISIDLAEEVYKALDVQETRPSAMQIRYAGCKGMLVVDPNLKGKTIMFRKSMRKFKSKHESLEILKFSEKRVAVLNRPLVAILEQLGLPKEVFLKLQKDMIQSHIMAMFQEAAACEFLHMHSLLRLDFLSMHAANIHFTEDPLFRDMIYFLFKKQIEGLKRKANIEIPPNKGRTMFGVVDETFTLEYGQVFVQYCDWYTDKPCVYEGTVVVTKNPCMHPGDVRKFQAVDVKALHHIKDCIVFPAKGPRPHPDEMAGSDLDGDEYHVMWLEELTFSRENHTPMDFARKKIENSEDKKNSVVISEQLDHFCDLIFEDTVGLLASAHLVWADQIKNGIYSPVCLRLAQQYSIALDFAKSGLSAPRNFRDIPVRYPDFTEKLGEKRSYLSTNALGMLYRSCKRLEVGLDTERNEIDYILDNALEYKGSDKDYSVSAGRVYRKYCAKISKLLRTYGFESEGQLLAGALLNPPKMYQNRHELSNLMVLLEYEVQFLFRDLERKFFDEFGGKPKDSVYTDAMFTKASAWYMLAYSKGSQFFGMPWAIAKVLVQLKYKNNDLNPKKFSRSKTILEEIVDKSISGKFPQMSLETESIVIHENRLAVLDVGQKILSKWVKSHSDYFTEPDLKKIEKYISQEFDNITSGIVCGDVKYIDILKRNGKIKKAISPCCQVIEALLHIAKFGSQRTKLCFSDVQQEVGLLAWMTLIKLACTYNPHYLGIANEHGQYAKTVFYKPQDDIIENIQLPVFDLKDEANMKFSHAVIYEQDKVKEYLLQQTKVKEIYLRYVDVSNSEFLRIAVRGTRYAIERLKDIVLMKDFFESVAEAVTDKEKVNKASFY